MYSPMQAQRDVDSLLKCPINQADEKVLTLIGLLNKSASFGFGLLRHYEECEDAIYLIYGGTDCDLVAATSKRTFKRGNWDEFQKYVDQEKKYAEGPCWFRLVSKEEYEAFETGIERDYITEAFEDGRGTAHIV